MQMELIRTKTARNIDIGNTVLGLELPELVVVFIAFQLVEMIWGLFIAFFAALAAYGGLYYLRKRQAPGFLMHAGRWLAEPQIQYAFLGRSERGEYVGRDHARFSILD
jgi:hypothetical protein